MLVAFIIIVIHWIADFVLQTEDMAMNKSKSFKALIKHTFVYSLCWYLVLFGFSVWGNHFGGPSIEELGWSSWMMLFPVITFVFHTLTDYVTSRITSKKFENKQYYAVFPKLGAFSVIGLDQVLHYAQLFLTYHLLCL